MVPHRQPPGHHHGLSAARSHQEPGRAVVSPGRSYRHHRPARRRLPGHRPPRRPSQRRSPALARRLPARPSRVVEEAAGHRHRRQRRGRSAGRSADRRDAHRPPQQAGALRLSPGGLQGHARMDHGRRVHARLAADAASPTSVSNGVKTMLKLNGLPANGTNGHATTNHAQAAAPPPGGGNGGTPVTKKVRPTLSNESNGVPLSLKEVRQHLLAITKGWPNVAAGALCYRRKDKATDRRVPEYIRDAADLFAWIDERCQVRWSRKEGRSTKEEFLRYLQRRSERFAWATDLPHWPPLPDVLYTNPPPAPANTGRLDDLVGMFELHSDIDRILVKAFVLTPFWGGPPGKRPLFTFSAPDSSGDPNAGRGAGKTTVAQ